jgi:hypothetical protein
MTTDMSGIIVPKSDQINADSLLAGPLTVTIESVAISPRDDQPVSIKLRGMDKVYRPCKSMARVLVHAYGPDAYKYAGKSMTLYCDPKVKWGGMEVGGIRISHLSDIDKEMVMMLTQTQKQRAPFKVKPLTTAAPASEPDNALDLAETAARAGTEAFRAWWSSDEGKSCRVTAQANIDRLKQLAAEADGPSDDAPM